MSVLVSDFFSGLLGSEFMSQDAGNRSKLYLPVCVVVLDEGVSPTEAVSGLQFLSRRGVRAPVVLPVQQDYSGAILEKLHEATALSLPSRRGDGA
jgi:hypothetical protein